MADYNNTTATVGHVYQDGKPVPGAHVEAVSVDGKQCVSNTTDRQGTYLLHTLPGEQYKVTATNKGLKHSLWPFPVKQETTGGSNDINLTAVPRSVIMVSFSQPYWYSDIRVLIEAVPADGSMPVTALAKGNGSYSLDVKPGMNYSLRGRCYDPFGQNGYVRFIYPGVNPGKDLTVGPDETVMAGMDIMFVHPPKSISFYRDPVTGNIDPFKPYVPVTITGHVYFDGQPARGAKVDAYLSSFLPEKRVSTITNESGAYVLTINSRSQYTLSASYNGLSRSVWPVIVQDNTTGACDINITWTIISMITGVPDEDQGWLAKPGNVIMAVPVGGGNPLTAVTGTDGRYTLNVKPFTYYDVSGKFQKPEGPYYNLSLYYANGIRCDGFMLRENETVFVNYYSTGYRG